MKSRIQLILLLFCLFPSFILAQAKKKMTLVDRLEIPETRGGSLSPDGTQLAYTISKTDWKVNKQISHIWRINIDGSEEVKLTSGENGDSSPLWSPVGNEIAFLSKRNDNENTQIYILNNSGGEATQLSHHATGVSSISWSHDGSFIYFLASDDKTEEAKERLKMKDDVIVYDVISEQRHLWKVALADGSETKITDGDFSAMSYKVSRDDKMVTFLKSKSPLLDDNNRREICVMDMNSGDVKQITKNQVAESNIEISPDNSKIIYIIDANEKFETYYNDNLFVSSIDGEKVEMLMPKLPYAIVNASWSADGSKIYFTANMGVHTELFSYDLKSDKSKQLTDGEHTIRGWYYDANKETHLLKMANSVSLGDAWVLSTKPKSKPIQVTHVYDYLDEKFVMPKVEAIQWKGEDGVEVEGILVYPVDYVKGKKYPLIVRTHGGPMSTDQYGIGGWSNYYPVAAAKGYVVLSPNYRGSIGYGDEFLRDMVGSYFNQSHLDVMAGVDYLIDKGIVDESKMVKVGWSAGGHMTNKIITFTDRFKAASSGAGAINWISMYGQSDTRIYRTPWFGGTPWEKDAPIDVYWNSSPLKDIWKVKTPTIIFVGQNDDRVPPPQSIELFRALKSNGVPTQLYVAPREPHGWRELRHRLFKVNVELEWFEKYAMNKVYDWEKAPLQ